MASTNEPEVEAHERHRGCRPASGIDSSRLNGLDRDRDLGRPDRAAPRRRGRKPFHLDVPSWLVFIGSFAGVVLTFLAGAEVDVPQFRREWRASLSIGLVSFFAPFAVVGLLCFYALDWSRRQAEIGGLALSTTSLAVVYAVLVETGLNRELVGKRLMSATFVTDIATVIGLTVLFIKPTLWIVPFALVSLALIVACRSSRRGSFHATATA